MQNFKDSDFSQLFQDTKNYKDLDFSMLPENAFDFYPVSNTESNISPSQRLVSNDKEKTSSSETLTENSAKPNVCNICNKTFVRPSFLKKHLKIHSEEISCKECLKVFVSKHTLKRHQRLHNNEEESTYLFKCNRCKHTYTRKDQLNSHLKDYQRSAHVCTLCNQKFCRKSHLKNHIHLQHACESATEMPRSDNNAQFKKKKMRQNFFSAATFKCCKGNNPDLSDFLNSLKTRIYNELLYQLNEKEMIKYFLTFEGAVIHSLEQQNVGISTLYIDSNVIYILSKTTVMEYIDKALAEIRQQFLQLKQDWTL